MKLIEFFRTPHLIKKNSNDTTKTVKLALLNDNVKIEKRKKYL